MKVGTESCNMNKFKLKIFCNSKSHFQNSHWITGIANIILLPSNVFQKWKKILKRSEKSILPISIIFYHLWSKQKTRCPKRIFFSTYVQWPYLIWKLEKKGSCVRTKWVDKYFIELVRKRIPAFGFFKNEWDRETF